MLIEEEKKQNARLARVIIGLTLFLLAWQAIFGSSNKKNFHTTETGIVADDVAISADDDYDWVATTSIHSKSVTNEFVAPKLINDVIDESINKRIQFQNEEVLGYINLKGAVIDYLSLKKYFNSTDKKSNIGILSPYGTEYPYYLVIGWFGSSGSTSIPNINTVWESNQKKLDPSTPLVLKHDNKKGEVFFITISLDDSYMLTINQKVISSSKKKVSYEPFISITRAINPNTINKDSYVGPVGVFDGKFTELPYKKLAKSSQEFHNQSDAWVGISDKYWLSSTIPAGDSSALLEYREKSKNEALLKITSRTRVTSVKNASGDTIFESTSRVFLGPKDINTLEKYSNEHGIKLFSRSIDLGRMYFITKPILQMLNFINLFFNNYGVSIIIMTILIRLALFPLASRSFTSMSKIKRLAPKIEELKKTHKTKQELDRATLALYRTEKVNPFSGIVPLLIQIPVFFALYKALYVSIELRHSVLVAGWINDLSVADPTSVVNLFGLLPFEAPKFLKIGVLPILVGLTMWLQQKNSPTNSLNKDQMAMMRFLPLIFTFLFASLPSGLLLYWVVSNLFSFFQQFVMERLQSPEN